MSRIIEKYLSLFLITCLVVCGIPFKSVCSSAAADGFVVYEEGKIEEQKTEETFIEEEKITQEYITENMTCEDMLYEVQINEEITAQAYTIELTVDVNTETTLAGLLPSQMEDYDIDWASVIAKFAIGTSIIVVVGVIQYVTKGQSTYFIMTTPGEVLKDAIVGGAIEAALRVSINEISQDGISSGAATKYAVEGFADGYMWGAISSVLKVTKDNLKRYKALKTALGETINVSLDGTVLDAAGNVIGKAFSTNAKEGLWYLVDETAQTTRVFDAAGKELLSLVGTSFPANATLALGVGEALKECFTDATGKLYRIGDELLPNIEYQLGNAIYKTDAKGRIIEVAFDQLKLRTRSGRLTIADTIKAIGKGDALSTDQRGHLIGDMFDGDNTLANIVAMSPNANQGTVREVETIWANTLKAGGNVSGKITIKYSGSSFRPTKFKYSWDLGDGKLKTKLISNR